MCRGRNDLDAHAKQPGRAARRINIPVCKARSPSDHKRSVHPINMRAKEQGRIIISFFFVVVFLPLRHATPRCPCGGVCPRAHKAVQRAEHQKSSRAGACPPRGGQVRLRRQGPEQQRWWVDEKFLGCIKQLFFLLSPGGSPGEYRLCVSSPLGTSTVPLPVPCRSLPRGKCPLEPPWLGLGLCRASLEMGGRRGSKGRRAQEHKGVSCGLPPGNVSSRRAPARGGAWRRARTSRCSESPKGRGAQGSGQRVPNGLESCREWEKAFTGLCKTAEEPPLSLHCPKPGAWHESSRRHRHLPAAGMHQRLPHNRTPVLCWQQHGKHPG